jgi:hypothetical protein
MKPNPKVSEAGDPYQQVDCPNGLPAFCQAMNAWGKAWEEWGNQVKSILDNLGPPTGVSPPPPPPFK